MNTALTVTIWLINIILGFALSAIVYGAIFPLLDSYYEKWKEHSAMWEALKTIREAGSNTDTTAQWMQRWAAWAMDQRFPKPTDTPPRHHLDRISPVPFDAE